MENLEAGVPDWQRTTIRYQRSKCEWRKTIALQRAAKAIGQPTKWMLRGW
jgi:hypothetical protein